MSIKTSVIETEKPVNNWKKVKYPCIGVAENGEVVLFHAFEQGVSIKAGTNKDGNSVGTYWVTRVMDCFTPAPTSNQYILRNI